MSFPSKLHPSHSYKQQSAIIPIVKWSQAREVKLALLVIIINIIYISIQYLKLLGSLSFAMETRLLGSLSCIMGIECHLMFGNLVAGGGSPSCCVMFVTLARMVVILE